MIRFIRYWYTYRTFVAVLLAILISGAGYWLYTQQLIGDAGQQARLNISVHPEDRIMAGVATSTDPNIVIVGIDNGSIGPNTAFPFTRDYYATLLQNLEHAGASVVAFDVAFPDRRDDKNDNAFATALKTSSIPIVLAYGGSSTRPSDGQFVQHDLVDQMPLKKFWCADADESKSTPMWVSGRPTSMRMRTASCGRFRCLCSRTARRRKPVPV